MARVTRSLVNAALARAGFVGVEIVHGRDYWYFTGDVGRWPRTAVYVAQLGAFTVEQWVEEARQASGTPAGVGAIGSGAIER